MRAYKFSQSLHCIGVLDLLPEVKRPQLLRNLSEASLLTEIHIKLLETSELLDILLMEIFPALQSHLLHGVTDVPVDFSLKSEPDAFYVCQVDAPLSL